MDSSSFNLFLFILFWLMVAASAFFASSETAYASANRIKLKSKSEAGNKKAERALEIEDNFDKALTTILIGNNIMHIGASSVATLLASRLWGNDAVTIVTLFVTLVLFMLGETIPKRFATTHSMKLSLGYSGTIRFLMWLLTPVSAFFNAISRMVTRILGSDTQPTVNEDELLEIIEDYTEDIEKEDHPEILTSAFRFSVTSIENIMTPIQDVVSLPMQASRDRTLSLLRTCRYSRIPIYSGLKTNIVGVLNVKAFYRAYLSGKDVKISKMMTSIPKICMNENPDDALELMNANKKQMAAVTNADGIIVGIITSDDVLEELVGTITDDRISREGGAK